MLVKEIIVVALAAIRANALRSFLTTLGIVIGVGAVIAMVALGEGAQRSVEQQIQRMGTNVLTIRPGQSMWGGISRESGVRLTVEDAEALVLESGGLLQVAPETQSGGSSPTSATTPTTASSGPGPSTSTSTTTS